MAPVWDSPRAKARVSQIPLRYQLSTEEMPDTTAYPELVPKTPLPPGPPPRVPPTLDAVDRDLVTTLLADGRASNVALARSAGIAESTALARVRSLHERGVVTGYAVQLDYARLGLPIQAIVAVRLAGQDRRQVDAFGEHVSGLPGVLAAYNVSGSDDFLVHLVAQSPDALRDVVLTHLSGHPGVVHVQTSLVFRSHPGRAPLPPLT